MARIQGIPEESASWWLRISYWLARRRVRRVPEPLMVKAKHPAIFWAYGSYELMLERARRLDPKLKALASLKAATLVGCPF
jgi:hypothetical protein